MNENPTRSIIEKPMEWIHDDEGPIALILRHHFSSDSSVFLTDSDLEQQLGLIVHPEGAVIQAHDHEAPPRTIKTCPECLIVRKGSCEMTLYDRKRDVLSVHVLRVWDVVLLLGGGHGFKMLEDCELLETRAGSFPGDSGKERF